MNKELKVIYNENAEVGENPIWDIRDQCCYFIDIRGKCVFKEDGHEGFKRIDLPQQIGCMAICENGDLLVALEDAVYRMNKSGDLTKAHQDIEIKGRRFNDGKVGPDGAFYVGTTDDNGNGAFYRLRGGELTELFCGCACSNGIDWTRDGKTMYYIDSPKQMVEAFDFDTERGELSNRRKFADIPREWGLPDGMTLDSEDNFWVALWNGQRVMQIDKDSKEVVGEIAVPCPKASCCAFGGEELSELYITTAAMTDTDEYSRAGNTFKVKLDVKGKPINYYKW